MTEIESTTKISNLERQLKELLERYEDMEGRYLELETENKRLRELLQEKGESKSSKKPKFNLKYSVENTSVKKKRRHKSTGRRDWGQKLSQVTRTESVYPSDTKAGDCIPYREQYAWRLVNGKAEYVCYTLYSDPESKTSARVAGLRNSRSEYGIEIILSVAFLHYWIGISIDHVCEVVRFFTGLNLSKSQADSLLNQLSRDWSQEYDRIAELIALQLVIYVDETGWSVGKQSCYTWAFSSALHVLFRCGVGRSKAEAQTILGEKFNGIGVSDDYAAYKDLFETHQLCWAHLLRKAIKLMLQHPDQPQYATFFQDLYAIYQQAISYQRDQRLSVGRKGKVQQLKAQIRKLCTCSGETIDPLKTPTDKATFIRLQNELLNGIEALFVFVEHPEVEATNNRSERNIRREAEIRKGGRTSKSEEGANRRSIIMTVLATLNTRFEKFTLDKLLSEVAQWVETGLSRFQLELHGLENAQPPPVS